MTILRILTVAVAALALPCVAAAQQPRAYVGGTVDLLTQADTNTSSLGGTVWGGRALFGVQVSPRVAVEFEPSFNGSYSWSYTYHPTASLTADVIAARRNMFFSAQARIRYGVLEPVVGLSYVHAQLSRHATIGTSTYFDDRGSDNSIALVAGVDVAIPVAPHAFFVPSIRMFVLTSTGGASANPLEFQTSTEPLAFRYGAGVRATF